MSDDQARECKVVTRVLLHAQVQGRVLRRCFCVALASPWCNHADACEVVSYSLWRCKVVSYFIASTWRWQILDAGCKVVSCAAC